MGDPKEKEDSVESLVKMLRLSLLLDLREHEDLADLLENRVHQVWLVEMVQSDVQDKRVNKDSLVLKVLLVFLVIAVSLDHKVLLDEMDLLEKMVYQEEMENQDPLDQLPSKESTSSPDTVKQLLYPTVHTA